MKSKLQLNTEKKTLRANTRETCMVDLEISEVQNDIPFPLNVDIYLTGDVSLEMRKNDRSPHQNRQSGRLVMETPLDIKEFLIRPGTKAQVVTITAVAPGFAVEILRIRQLRAQN